MNNTDQTQDFIPVSSRIDEDGYTEIIVGDEAFIQVCTTCGTPIPFHQKMELDEEGNCAKCQGASHA